MTSSPIMPSRVAGLKTTRSPIATLVTSAPTASITPAMSPPEMKGMGTARPGMPRRTSRSR